MKSLYVSLPCCQLHFSQSFASLLSFHFHVGLKLLQQDLVKKHAVKM